MDYKKELQKLWDTDKSYQKLASLKFNEIGMRGIKNLEINFSYPITAIAGANGIGKTTVLQTIACLFHNNDNTFQPYRFSNTKNQQPYYKFTDFFVISRGENRGLGAEMRYVFNKQGMSRSEFAIKKIQRWGNYERRPERYVDFLGISRILPAHEFSIFKNTFSGNYTVLTNIALSEENRQMVGNITGKSLTNIEEHSCSIMKNFKLNKISSAEGLNYSSFNMGAGEEVAITLISRISNLPSGSLVLIEEIELGLHPKAQQSLIESLMKIVKVKKLQLIFTTHSPYVFDVLPFQAKILLKKIVSGVEVIEEPSNSLAFIELTGSNCKDLTIYVEDEIAKQLIENLFNSMVSKRIEIVDVGSKENVIRMTAAHYINPQLGNAIGIPDGDASDKEFKDWCKKYMLLNSDEGTQEEFEGKKASYFETLPSDVAPEKYIFNKLKENDDFILNLDDSEDFLSFIKNNLDISDDHHALFFKISQYMAKDLDGIKRDILKYVSKTYKEEFIKIIDLVNNKLESSK